MMWWVSFPHLPSSPTISACTRNRVTYGYTTWGCLTVMEQACLLPYCALPHADISHFLCVCFCGDHRISFWPARTPKSVILHWDVSWQRRKDAFCLVVLPRASIVMLHGSLSMLLLQQSVVIRLAPMGEVARLTLHSPYRQCV